MTNNRLLIPILIFVFVLRGAGAAEKNTRPLKGEEYQDFSSDGAWCWFADPRAVYHKGAHERIYGGWVDSFGSIWAASLDLETGQKIETKLYHEFEKDDHANPSLLILPDGRLAVFYSAHGGTEDKGMRYRISQKPEDVLEWGEEMPLKTNTGGPRGTCYPNPFGLSKEKGRIYLFWRGGNFKPTVSWTDDLKDWAEARTLIASDDDSNVRPYTKFASDSRERIHVAFTDGHPRNEPTNSIYYACYRNGAFRKADGTKITDMTGLPIKHKQADLVYDGKKTGVRAWIWDVAADKKNRPVIVYSRLPEETDHRYHYAQWDGKKWDDHEICPAGPWFPATPEGKKESEPHYSGGVVLDSADPAIVFLSRKIGGVFEIERWETMDGGKTWKSEAVTSNSTHNNVRPFVIRNHPKKQKPDVLWMLNEKYVHYTDYRTAIKMDVTEIRQNQ
jgi:hypothetical protein